MKTRVHTYRWSSDVANILDTVEGNKTAWIEHAIRLKAGTPSEELLLRREHEAIERQEADLAARKRVVQSKLAAFDQVHGSLEEQLRTYLRGDPSEQGQRNWAKKHGLSWEEYQGKRRLVMQRA